MTSQFFEQEPGKEFEIIKLLISDKVKKELENRQIRVENIRRVIDYAEKTGDHLINRETGHKLARNRELNVTFWVEYSVQDDGYVIHNAYSHRMEIGPESDVKTTLAGEAADTPWHCAKCDSLLEPRTIVVHYLKYDFPVSLLKCQKCDFVLVTEDLALGKMAEVEQLLEDK